ncbi:MAG: hypothetical protein OEN01_07375 [Candidatus Krumholzibacteria bacterium]|nr:hypothetical protein [Candidatus Krumholzibacteria bacterium]
MYWRATIASLLVAGVFLLPAQGLGDDSPSKSSNLPTYKLRASVVGAAGAPSQTTGFQQRGTLAQPTPIGIRTESGGTLYAGFWNVWMGTATGIVEEMPVFTDKLSQNRRPNTYVFCYDLLRDSEQPFNLLSHTKKK